MKKLRTREDFHKHLDSEFSWRLKEMADIRKAIDSAEDTARRAIIRAGVAILYAHWEGFVKAASEALLNFISRQRLTYRHLTPAFIVFGARKGLNDFIASNQASRGIAVVDFFLRGLDERANISFEGSIRTGHNLGSQHFERIASSLGLDPSGYQSKFPLIDSSLLQRRNMIAHGEFLDVNRQEFEDLSDQVINLMRKYKNDIQNVVEMKSYMQSP